MLDADLHTRETHVTTERDGDRDPQNDELRFGWMHVASLQGGRKKWTARVNCPLRDSIS